MFLTSLENTILATIALPFFAALIAHALDRVSRPARNWLVVLALAINLGLALGVGLAGLRHGRPIHLTGQPAGPLPTGLSLALDGSGGVALPLTALVCLAVGTFSTGYVQPGRFVGGYFALILLAAGALNAVLLAGDLVALSAGLALLGVVLSALVGLDFARGAGAAATKILLMVEASAVLVLSTAWLILARGGSVELAGLLARNAAALGAWLSVAVGLLVVALATITALAPLHTWLTTGARHALTPVAALLAGGVLPVGLIVCLRVLGPSPEVRPAWPLLALLGGLSVVVAALGAFRTAEFLPALAFQAVGQVGFAAVALAEGTSEGRAAALYQLATLALFLPLLILGVGAVLQVARSDALGDFSRLRVLQPVAAATALVGAAAVTGLPPFPGYWSRLRLLEILLQPGHYHLPLLLVVVLGSVLLTASLLRLLKVEAPLSPPVLPGRRLAILAPLLGLSAVGFLAAFVPLDLALRLVGRAPDAAPTTPALGIVATLLLLGALATGAALRLGELSLLPAGLQAAFDAGARRLALAAPLAARARKRVRPEWLDAYAAVGGLLTLVAWAAARLLDNTLGRLGRNA